HSCMTTVWGLPKSSETTAKEGLAAWYLASGEYQNLRFFASKKSICIPEPSLRVKLTRLSREPWPTTVSGFWERARLMANRDKRQVKGFMGTGLVFCSVSSLVLDYDHAPIVEIGHGKGDLSRAGHKIQVHGSPSIGAGVPPLGPR